MLSQTCDYRVLEGLACLPAKGFWCFTRTNKQSDALQTLTEAKVANAMSSLANHKVLGCDKAEYKAECR